MYIIELTYKTSLDEVNKYLPDHIIYLQSYYDKGNFICSGRKEPRTGGIILCNFISIDEVNKAIESDPFFKNDIAEYQIIEFIPTKSSDMFKKIIS